MRQDLHRLPQTHVVGQNPGQVVFAQELQPVQPVALIGAQRAVKILRNRDPFDPAKVPQLATQLTRAFAAGPDRRGVAERLVQLGQERSVERRERKRPVRCERTLPEQVDQRAENRLNTLRRHYQGPAVGRV